MIKFEVKGLDKVKKLLEDLKEAGKHPGPAMDLVGQRMLAMQKRHFIKQEWPDGTAWEPLSLKTIAGRRKGGARIYRTRGGKLKTRGGYGMETARALQHFGGAIPVAGIRGVQILRDTGLLYRSLVYEVAMDGTGVVAGAPKMVVYAPTHQYGDRSRNIPARPFIYINATEGKQLLNLFKREVLKLLE